MAYTTQKTVTATRADDGTKVRAGLIDPSVQALPQKEVLERDTVRYEPVLVVRLAPNTDDDVNPGVLIEAWSE